MHTNTDASRCTLSSISRLALTLVNVADFRKMLLTMLGATSVSALRFTVRLSLTKAERIYYLNPIRDIFGDTGWIESEIKIGARVVIAGLDVETMVNRIKDPVKCWTGRKLNIWLIIMKTLRLVREIQPGDDGQRLLVETNPEADADQIRRVFRVPHGLLQTNWSAGTTGLGMGWRIDNSGGSYIWVPYISPVTTELTVWRCTDMMDVDEGVRRYAVRNPTMIEHGIITLNGEALQMPLLGVTAETYARTGARTDGRTIPYMSLTGDVTVYSLATGRLLRIETAAVAEEEGLTENEIVLCMERATGDVVTYIITV